MSQLLLVAAIGAGALSVISMLLVAALSLRALRRGAALDAEMKAPSFAFRIHLRPGDQTSPPPAAAPATQRLYTGSTTGATAGSTSRAVR